MNDVVAYESKYGGIILDSSQAPASVVTIKGESSKNPEVEIIPYYLFILQLINNSIFGVFGKRTWCLDLDGQGYPQRMRLQRRLYGIYTVCFLIHIYSIQLKPCIFILLNLQKGYIIIYGWRFNSTMIPSYYKSFMSSLQSHPMWVTLK